MRQQAKFGRFCMANQAWVCLVLLLLAATAHGTIPTTITIQGKLTGSTGRPLTGTRLWRVQFYDAPINGNALGTPGSGLVTVAASGRFTIELTPPVPALTAAALYYELAIDSAATPDGAIGSTDVFPSRVKVTSVLRAQNAAMLGGQSPAAFATASHTHALSTLSGQIAQAQVPAGLTVDHAHDAILATTATKAISAISALSAPEHDTLASVTGRGASTAKELTLSGGVQLPPLAAPPALSNRLLNTSSSLYWNGRPLQPAQGPAFITVQVGDIPTSNGLALLAAYARAKALKPHSQDLSTTNRACVLVPPGRYDLGSRQLVLDAEFVDLVGLSSAAKDQFITGASAGLGTGVLRQTANDVALANLLVECTWTSTKSNKDTDPAAYFPDSGTTATLVSNCEFRGTKNGWSMRLGVAYPGTYRDCVAGWMAFGAFKGVASGSFTNCTGGFYAFGSGQGTASGTFTNCTGGPYSFGADHGTASGTFIGCTGSFASFGGDYGMASGTFTNCTGDDDAFGGWDGTASGIFTGCRGGATAFGGDLGTASGTFINCTGGNSAFGGDHGTASGTFTGCIGGNQSFGGYYGTASGTFNNCTGGAYSFGAYNGMCSGIFVNCTGGSSAFGGANFDDLSRTVSARLKGCQMTDGSNPWYGTFAGKMENCSWAIGVWLGASARIYNCTFLGILDLNNTAAGVTQSRAQSINRAGSNIFGATNAAALNIASGSIN